MTGHSRNSSVARSSRVQAPRLEDHAVYSSLTTTTNRRRRREPPIHQHFSNTTSLPMPSGEVVLPRC